jgi:hypothetical protein
MQYKPNVNSGPRIRLISSMISSTTTLGVFDGGGGGWVCVPYEATRIYGVLHIFSGTII